MIRNRGTKDPLKVVRQFDAFPKIPQEYKVGSSVGGARKLILTNSKFSEFINSFLFCSVNRESCADHIPALYRDRLLHG